MARDRERDKPRPRPAPIPTGQQRALQESGGSLLGVRFATSVLAATDPRLQQAAKLFLESFLWLYHPGRIYRRPAKRIGLALGLAERTWKQALAQLKRHGYIQRCEGGWISPPVELKLPPEKRAWNEQLAFPFVADWDTLGAAKHLGLAVENSNPKVHSSAPEGAPECTPRCTGVHVHPRPTPDLPLTNPAYRAECSPRPVAGSQGELFTGASDEGQLTGVRPSLEEAG